ncbi:MAG: sigma-54-dependent Fis family transcriptional regulator [Betaproteobacteria bacterium]|nr:sigma-54-dependent Fis family transcriptional regulator [Betaproteobacteria bacterium]
MNAKNQVLVVDDEADIRELLSMTLSRMGLEAHCAASTGEAFALLETNSYDLCLTDMRLPDGDGLQVLEHVAKHHPTVPVAVITAHSSAENAVAALKAGAFDYVSKPVQLQQLRTLVQQALKLNIVEKPRKTPRSQTQIPRELFGTSPSIQQAKKMIERVARSQAPVYVSGESGSGKELAARLIHQQSARSDGPFFPVNCGAIPENLMESEFFGYKKGAFTGAAQDKQGFFQAAHGGTLFLDEVAELPLAMQVKLLRVIQEKNVRLVGSNDEIQVDVRIISATHQDLHQLVTAGDFRQDLFYRLAVIELKMPPLRDMGDDIPLLASQILARLTKPLQVTPPKLSFGALKALQSYSFPGNVRELENILERALTLAAGEEIRAEDLQLEAREDTKAISQQDLAGLRASVPLPEYLERIEKEAIIEALNKTRYNRTAAAKLLGITFRALRYRMERLGINDELESKG